MHRSVLANGIRTPQNLSILDQTVTDDTGVKAYWSFQSPTSETTPGRTSQANESVSEQQYWEILSICWFCRWVDAAQSVKVPGSDLWRQVYSLALNATHFSLSTTPHDRTVHPSGHGTPSRPVGC